MKLKPISKELEYFDKKFHTNFSEMAQFTFKEWAEIAISVGFIPTLYITHELEVLTGKCDHW